MLALYFIRAVYWSVICTSTQACRHGLTLVAFPDPSIEALGMVPSLIHVISRLPLQSYSHGYSQTPSAKGTLP